MNNIEQLRKVATRAGKLLTSLSESIRQQKEELKLLSSIRNTAKPLCISCLSSVKAVLSMLWPKWKPVATFSKRNLLVIR